MLADLFVGRRTTPTATKRLRPSLWQGRNSKRLHTTEIQTPISSALLQTLSRANIIAYDSMGNTTNVTQLAGTQNAVTTMLTYDSTFNQLNSITDP